MVEVIISSRKIFAHSIPVTGTISTTVEALIGPTLLIKTTNLDQTIVSKTKIKDEKEEIKKDINLERELKNLTKKEEEMYIVKNEEDDKEKELKKIVCIGNIELEKVEFKNTIFVYLLYTLYRRGIYFVVHG